MNTRQLTQAGLIAALYIALTMALMPIAFGPIQFRLSEALTVLPILYPASIPGLFIGCLLSNLLNADNLGLLDILGGSLSTLLAAYWTYHLGRRYREQLASCREQGSHVSKAELGSKLGWPQRLLPLMPPVLVNALIVGTYLTWIFCDSTLPTLAWLTNILSIALSELFVLLTAGLLLLLALEKRALK